MIKKISISLCVFILILPFFISPLKGELKGWQSFLAAVVSVNDNTTATSGGGTFTSTPIRLIGLGNQAALTIYFTPAVGAAVNIDLEFAVSTDDGTTYSTAENYQISIPTNTQAVGGVVVYSMPVDLAGCSHIMLLHIKVGNGAGNCTNINARLSW